MGTTVIGSRHGVSLWLLPAAGPRLKRDALAQVLERYGLTLAGGADLGTANEFIAAENLDPTTAARLADDLRAIGLSARVVNRTGLTASSRVGNALATQMFVAMTGLLGAAASATSGLAYDELGFVLGVSVIAFAALNAIVLQWHGSGRLRVVGAPLREQPPAQLTDQLSNLADHLPNHVVAPLLEKARVLQAHAHRDPDGQAASELEALLADLRKVDDDAAVQEVRALREELARARRALRESGGH
jgi:hypothetical protein